MPMEEECLLKLPLGLGEAATTFDLEKVVCSHGLFMLSPNRWDPLSKSLSRPLHLTLDPSSTESSSVMVTVSQPQEDPHSLHIKVHNTGFGSSLGFLSPEEQETLLAQVARMLRLSESDERNVRGFKRVVAEGPKECDYMRRFSGRVFRSPTLFEDMVKCMLLCNCQWQRTLSMARALCELQLELQHFSSSVSVAEAKTTDFIPETPAGKESKRKRKVSKVATNLTSKLAEIEAGLQEDVNLELNCVGETKENLSLSNPQNDIEEDSLTLNEQLDLHSKVTELYGDDSIGNFPSPRELANVDESFLAKRCNLGYRAGRIIKLAQDIVEGRIQINQLEQICNEGGISSYENLSEQLSKINGFGPFTCANVLVCMGFYHVIPTDSETIRHLKQVHKRKSSIRTVQSDVEKIYGKYEPFQFLAYWSEIWHFYEEWFGKLSEMPHSDYKLITASKMGLRTKKSQKVRRRKST